MRRIINVWDDNNEGAINLLEFAEIVRDLQVFEQFDLDRSGFISAVELRSALGKLGVPLTHPETSTLLAKCTRSRLRESIGPWSCVPLPSVRPAQSVSAHRDSPACRLCLPTAVSVSCGADDDDKSGMIEFPEFRKLAEDLPSLVGREKGSFFQLHNADRAYVHAEDVRDNMMHADLDTTFKKESMTKRERQAHGGAAPTSVLGGNASCAGAGGGGGSFSVLGGGASFGAPPPTGTPSIFGGGTGLDGGGDNPFNSRMFAMPAQQPDRAVRLRGSAKPKLHESRSMLRD